MAKAYTPALLVTSETKLRRLRELPLPGSVLVKVGDKVSAEQAVLSAEIPGDVEIVKLPERSGLELEQVKKGLVVKVGQEVKKGEELLNVKSCFGLFVTSVKAPSAGAIEFFNKINGHLGIRGESKLISLSAYVSGQVVEVEENKAVTIESTAAVIQGVFGVGGERYGQVLVLPVANNTLVEKQDLAALGDKICGKVIVGGLGFSAEALIEAGRLGVSAVLTGSISSETLGTFLGFDIGVAITGAEEIPFTLIITEGFGALAISERVTDLAKKLEGKMASVNGATQVRAGAVRPELIVCDAGVAKEAAIESAGFIVGSTVRIVRTPYFGLLAQIVEVPTELKRIESGACVRVLKVKLNDGSEAYVPRANVELV